MKQKRFNIINKEEPRKQSVTENGIPCTARHCMTNLNRLYEENQEYEQIIKEILQKTENKQTQTTPNYQITVQITPKTYEKLTKLLQTDNTKNSKKNKPRYKYQSYTININGTDHWEIHDTKTNTILTNDYTTNTEGTILKNGIERLCDTLNKQEQKNNTPSQTDTEKDYYTQNGLSPLQAFQQGLISKEEYTGFIKGNIIKYIIRCDKKGQFDSDLEKAKHYIELLKHTQ